MNWQDGGSYYIAKVINVKWETDGYDVDLPEEFEIPKKFINEDRIDGDAISRSEERR